MRFSITARLTLVFVLFAAVLATGIGVFAYERGRAALEQAIAADLLATALEKQAAINAWVEDSKSDVVTLATNPTLAQHLARHRLEAESAVLRAEHDEMLGYLSQWVGPEKHFLSLLILDPITGQVIAATDAAEEGRFQENRPYFSAGKQGAYVQDMYYSIQQAAPAMTAAAPIKAADGRLVGVLAGHLNLIELNAIVLRRTGLRQTDEAFLVNTANLFVTQPRLVADPAVLQRGIHTEAVNRCLAHASGVVTAPDYRDVPALVVYRWLPERQLCLIVKLDQAEAVAPTRAFGLTILVIAGLALLAASALAFGLARNITRPIHQLVKGAQAIGAGDLEYRIAVGVRDELGALAHAFNDMAVNLRASLGQTVRGHRLLAALSQAGQAVQRARTPEEVYRTVGDEVARLGYHAAVFTLTDDGAHLWIPYLNFDPALQRTAEKLVGISAADFRLPLKPGGFYQRVLAAGEAVFLDPFVEPIAEAVPGLLRPLIGQVTALLGIEQGIVAPLQGGDQPHSLLIVTGEDLTVEDTPAITTFANQTAIALENARLYQETRAWAAELAQRVEAQTETIRASEEKYRNLFENAQIGMYRSRLDGSAMLAVNHKLAEIFGYSVEEMLAAPATIRWANPDARNAMQRQLREKGKLLDYEVPILTKSGAVKICLTSLRLYPQEGYLEGSAIDITERKVAEGKLQAFAAELERSNQELERFAYIASHDLQEPLRMVTSYLQLIERRYGDRLDGDARDFFGYAVDGANRMKTLINDLLAYSRVGTRGKPFGPVSCQASLAEALTNLQVAIAESGAVITHDPLPTVTGDQVQLTQLFQNLIGNALKFHSAEPPTIHIAASETFEVSKTSKVWTFSVRDNGIGIDPKYFDRIFAIFQRLHTRNEYPGTGIGLAICKKIVERHGGRIWVESAVGKGATFYFMLKADL